MALPDQINAYQTELVKKLADKGSCVIVGRCADYVLQGREDCFHVFISGALPDRGSRVIAEHGNRLWNHQKSRQGAGQKAFQLLQAHH